MNNKYYAYTTIQGDTFDSIALKFYDDEFKSSEIMKENPHLIKTIVFESGIKIKVPIIEDEAPSTLPPWKR